MPNHALAGYTNHWALAHETELNMTHDIKQIIQTGELLSQLDLDLSRITVEWNSQSSLEYLFEIQAFEFVKFAELDLYQGTTHGLVNALSNAKRAIDCQVDSVLGCFGLLSRLNFPQKIATLNQMGIITPRIVNKVVKARNYLEHEFKMPELEQVEDAVDIATLFVTSLEQSLRHFPNDFVISSIVEGVFDEGHLFSDKWLTIDYDDEPKRFTLRGLVFDEVPTSESRKAHWIEKALIQPKETGFMELLNLAFSLEKQIPDKDLVSQAVKFFQLFSE
jgi:hypothetical protein